MIRVGTDVLVIGSGCAGLMAAIEAARSCARVVLLDKGLIGKSGCTVGAQQIAAVLPGSGDSIEAHIRDTMTAGCGVNNRRLVQVMAGEGAAAIDCLESMGVCFDRTESGGYALLPMNGHSAPRSLCYGDLTGKRILDVMRSEATRLGVVMMGDISLFALQREAGRVCGALGYDLARGCLTAFSSGAVVMATGGAGQLYSFSTNCAQANGDGLAMALMAGAVLTDLEFVQFYPGTVVSPAALRGTVMGLAQFGRLYNRQGERFMQRYEPELLEGATRDRLAQAICAEIREGRHMPGGGVQLDVTGLAPAVYEAFAAEMDAFSRCGINLREERVEVCPAAHYFMGGIQINEDGQTAVAGLFAAGEAAGGIHGANRLGNNSLLDCVVFGYRAGRAAARYAGRFGEQKAVPDTFGHLRARRPAVVLAAQLRQAMWSGMGLVRDESGLRQALATVAHLEQEVDHTRCDAGRRLRFHRHAAEVSELANMLVLARAMTLAALERRESRGAHRRADFPAASGGGEGNTQVRYLGGVIYATLGSDERVGDDEEL